MIRRSFLKRMALAAAACAFIDVPWPTQATPPKAGVSTSLPFTAQDGDVAIMAVQSHGGVAPSGWTRLSGDSGDAGVKVYYRVLGKGDRSPDAATRVFRNAIIDGEDRRPGAGPVTVVA